jgi:hypothetical protein
LFLCWGCVNLVRKQIQCDSIQRIFVNKLHHQIIVFLLAKLWGGWVADHPKEDLAKFF